MKWGPVAATQRQRATDFISFWPQTSITQPANRLPIYCTRDCSVLTKVGLPVKRMEYYFCCLLCCVWSRGSSVSVVTRLRAGRPTQPPIQWVPVALSPRVKLTI